MRWILALLVGLSLLAGAGAEEPVNLDQLVFENPREERRFVTARSFILERTRGWQHSPRRLRGNFIAEEWTAGDRSYKLNTLHYRLPRVFGLSLTARSEGVDFYYAEGGKTILGSSCHLRFRHGDLDIPVVAPYFRLPDEFEFKGRDTISVTPELPIDQELALLLASPTSLKERTEKRYQLLIALLDQALADDRIQKPLYGEYEGRGIPPPVIGFQSPSPTRKKQLRAQLKRQVDAWQTALDTDADAFYRLALELLPFHKLWPAALVRCADAPN